MDVTLTTERVLVLADHFDMAAAEERAAKKRLDAFGTMARMAGLLGKAKDEAIELVYKERRLQPFWSLSCTAVCIYERTRQHVLRMAPEVQRASIAGQTFEASAQQLALPLLETCRAEVRRTAVFDALTGQAASDLPGQARTAAQTIDPARLAAISDGTVVVPPRAKAEVVIRTLLADLGAKIEADRLVEETCAFDAIDLCYRPVYAFRFRRQGKEAVVEVDGCTGEVRLGGATFEAYLGKVLEPKFLLEVSAETLNLFLPGATLVKVLVAKGMEMKQAR
jgi:hypothetical protein